MKLSETRADCSAKVIRWIIENEHHRGYWTGSIEHPKEFVLDGHFARLRIPAEIHQPGLMIGSDYSTTKRMYEPTDLGRAALAQSVEKK